MVMNTANRDIIIKIHQILHICIRNEIRLIASENPKFFFSTYMEMMRFITLSSLQNE